MYLILAEAPDLKYHIIYKIYNNYILYALYRPSIKFIFPIVMIDHLS
jgi:hypothetical protein